MHYGGASTLRFHFGHPNNFGAQRGTELRGHFSRVPLDFPLEGIPYVLGSPQSRVAQCFKLIEHFSKLRVLSVYSYRTYHNTTVPLVEHFSAKVMSSLPATLEVIEFRFPGAMACFVATLPALTAAVRTIYRIFGSYDVSDRMAGALGSASAHPAPWIPLNTLFPSLKTLSVWCDWVNFPLDDKSRKGAIILRKALMKVLPPSLEHLDLDFLGLTCFGGDRYFNLPLLQTFTSTTEESPQSLELLKSLPPSLTHLVLSEAVLTPSQLGDLPPLLQSLRIKAIEQITGKTLPLPPHLTSLATASSSSWSKDMVLCIPTHVDVFRLRECKLEDLPKFSSLLARSVTFDYFSQSRSLLPYKIESLSDMNTVSMQQFKISFSPSFRSSMTNPAPIWAALRSLELPACHLSENCLLALPSTLILLDVASIRASGLLLDSNVTIVDEKSVTSSIKAWCRANLPKMEAVPPVTCIKLNHIPPSAQDVCIDYSAVKLNLLPNLTRLRHFANPILGLRPGQLPYFPPGITELDWTGCTHSYPSETLGTMPSSVTSFTGGYVVFRRTSKHDLSLEHFTSVKAMTFPDDLPAVLHGWTHVKLVGGASVMFMIDEAEQHISSLPKSLTELTLRGTGKRAASWTPRTELNPFSGQMLYFSHERIEELPPSLTRVRYTCGAQVHYPLSFIPVLVTDLIFENHFVNADTLRGISHLKNLKTLSVIGDGSKLVDGDMVLLPPSLTSFHLDNGAINSEAFANFPPSLTKFTQKADNEPVKTIDLLSAARSAPSNA